MIYGRKKCQELIVKGWKTLKFENEKELLNKMKDLFFVKHATKDFLEA